MSKIRRPKASTGRSKTASGKPANSSRAGNISDPLNGATESGTSKQANPQLLIENIKQSWADQKTINSSLAPEIKKRLEDTRRIDADAKLKFGALSGIPKSRRESQLFISQNCPQAELTEKHLSVMKTGLQRLSQNYQGALTLTIPKAEMVHLHINPDDPLVQEVPLAELLNTPAFRKGGSLSDRIRTRSLREWLYSPEIRAKSQLQGPSTDSPESSEPTTPPTENPPSNISAAETKDLILNRIAGQIQDLDAASLSQIEQRPDADTVKKSIEALELTGGPADVTAFHDFHILQLAFKDVWTEAFDGSLKSLGEELYRETVKHYSEMDQDPPGKDESYQDVAELKTLIQQIENEKLSWDTLSAAMIYSFSILPSQWASLSDNQRQAILAYWTDYRQAEKSTGSAGAEAFKAVIRNAVQDIIDHPDPHSATARLNDLIQKIGEKIQEKYSFDLFAPNTYNYGILLTYRQRWEPLTYQAGNLISTIPLAPSEVRKYTKKRNTKETRSYKTSEKESVSRSEQSSEIERAEAEIMRKTANTTSFAMQSQFTYSLQGMLSITAANQFSTEQKQDSADIKKDFHEATAKSAEEYRKEHALEIDTTASVETEETYSGEISNPNNEITVTYLFYELQRRYLISEQIHRAQGVILVAQEMPRPDQINEAWLVENQWILARYLLDESLRPALEYLTTGFAGDEASLAILQSHWEAQKNVLEKLEQNVSDQIMMRDALRIALAQTVMGKDLASVMGPNTTQDVMSAIFSGGMSLLFTGGKNPAADVAEANRKAAETRLKYAEEALADSQKKLQSATDAFQKATQEYTAALKQKFDRHLAIDQLRVHVKQNILHYMHGIWDCEPNDQRFFRLYDKKVMIFAPDSSQTALLQADAGMAPNSGDGVSSRITLPAPSESTLREVDLVEIADLDRPLGYKGNYIIFPLVKPCYLTTFMLQEFVDDYFGIHDPDELRNWPLEEVRSALEEGMKYKDSVPGLEAKLEKLRAYYIAMLTDSRNTSDEIIVPTGQLFIEALPGRHPLLEDFKLRHRMEDVRKAQAEVRHADLENLRYASRLVEGEREDPEIEKRILVDKGLGASINPDE